MWWLVCAVTVLVYIQYKCANVRNDCVRGGDSLLISG